MNNPSQPGPAPLSMPSAPLQQPGGNRLAFLLLGGSLSIGLMAATAMVTTLFFRLSEKTQTITVKGFAEKPIRSDVGYWGCSFPAFGLTLVEAYENLEKTRGAVADWLKDQAPGDVQLVWSDISSSTLFEKNAEGRSTDVIRGYSLRQSVSMSSKDLDGLARLSREVTGLFKQGIEVTSHSPSYFYTKLDDLKIDMLGAATRDARTRAEVMAAQSGSVVGELVSATQGVFQINAAGDTSTSDWGRSDTSSIDKSIRAVVTVEYAVRLP